MISIKVIKTDGGYIVLSSIEEKTAPNQYVRTTVEAVNELVTQLINDNIGEK